MKIVVGISGASGSIRSPLAKPDGSLESGEILLSPDGPHRWRQM